MTLPWVPSDEMWTIKLFPWRDDLDSINSAIDDVLSFSGVLSVHVPISTSVQGLPSWPEGHVLIRGTFNFFNFFFLIFF